MHSIHLVGDHMIQAGLLNKGTNLLYCFERGEHRVEEIIWDST